MLDVEAVVGWLSAAGDDLAPLVVRMYLFGSALETNSDPSDVDIIVVFTEWQVRHDCAELERSFLRVFGYRLHIQMFHESQTGQLIQFLEDARQTRRVM